MTVKRSLAGLAGSAAVTFATAYFGSRYKPDLWYRRLNKPEWTPPKKVFPTVWTALYALMSLGAWRVFQKGGLKNAKAPLAAYAGQLAANGAWSYLFFGKHKVKGAMADVLGLLSGVAATTFLFWKKSSLAGALMLPYLAWTLFATALNAKIWRMNR